MRPSVRGTRPGRTDGVHNVLGDATWRRSPVLGLVLALVLLWVVLGIVGVVVKGLIWLTIAAAVLFLLTLVFGGTRLRRPGPGR